MGGVNDVARTAYLEIYVQDPLVGGTLACFGEDHLIPTGGTITAMFTRVPT